MRQRRARRFLGDAPHAGHGMTAPVLSGALRVVSLLALRSPPCHLPWWSQISLLSSLEVSQSSYRCTCGDVGQRSALRGPV